MHTIQINREKRGLGFPDAPKLIRTAVRTTLKVQGVNADCVINVLLTDDKGIHAVNLEQRGVDAPTDVLSFPLNELTEGDFEADACEYDYESEKCMLGDMVLNLQRCAQQAEELGHSIAHEVSYLTAHSVLHLLGYDHMDEGPQKKRMRAREKIIMDALNID